MIVNIYETTKADYYCIGTINSNHILQISEELLKQLNYERNLGLPNMIDYINEMEKLHSNTFEGGTFTISNEGLVCDEFIGSLGLDLIDNYEITNSRRKLNGIC